jgi:hypothetical protein
VVLEEDLGDRVESASSLRYELHHQPRVREAQFRRADVREGLPSGRRRAGPWLGRARVRRRREGRDQSGDSRDAVDSRWTRA